MQPVVASVPPAVHKVEQAMPVETPSTPLLPENYAAAIGIGMALPNNSIPFRAPQSIHIPVSYGSWADPAKPGNSGWISTKPTVIAITAGKPIPFSNNLAGFDRWRQDRFNFPNLTGNNTHDFRLGHEAIAKKYNLPSNAAAERWLKQRGLMLHHHHNAVSLDVLPKNLHNKQPGIPHAGGATILRNWDYSKGTPWQEFRANQLAKGARVFGGVGMVYGAYTDGAGLVDEWQISQKTGNYSNTYNEAARVTGAWTLAWGGGVAGAKLGGAIGAFGGPVGVVVGGLIGGAIGGGIGYASGSFGANWLLK